MRKDFQSGDIVRLKCTGELGHVVTVLAPEQDNKPALLAVKFQGQKGIETEYADRVTKLRDHEDLAYPMPLTSWKALNKAEREAVIIEVLIDFGDFCDGMREYIYQPENQALFSAFIAEAIERRKTHKRYASKAIFEHLRWDEHRIHDAGQLFKINNNYTPDLARLAMRIFPELEEFFNTRHRKKAA